MQPVVTSRLVFLCLAFLDGRHWRNRSLRRRNEPVHLLGAAPVAISIGDRVLGCSWGCELLASCWPVCVITDFSAVATSRYEVDVAKCAEGQRSVGFRGGTGDGNVRYFEEQYTSQVLDYTAFFLVG